MVSPADVERLFLQAVLSRAVVSSDLAHVLWAKSIDAVNASSNGALKIQHSNDKQSWDDFVSKINRSLDKLELEFRALHDELTGKEMYAIANRKGDEIAQMATDYTPIEIAFFKAIVERIMLAPHESYSISSMAALREPTSAKLNITKSQAEIILGSFVAKGWLLKSKKGRYSLSTRSILELLPYLKSTYPEEIIECTICLEIMTRGVGCFTPNCKTRMHFHCFNTFRRRHNACPSCSKDWPRDTKDKQFVPVGEDAAREGDERVRRARSDDAEESDDEDEEEPPTQDTLPKKSQRDKKPVKSENTMDVDEDEDEDARPTQTQGTQRNRRSTRH
ncbi:Nse1 non-SMC component of SMC5-6 complex-domain-containing protein [Pholiota molesta]|nr:Nse1 non-SMC component of SMC5-6 complex-domain-containing protein [Pholiota molesta]